MVCWGDNQYGQSGGNAPTEGKNPTPMPVMMENEQPLTGAVSLAVGFAHSCAVLQNGQIACWGSNLCGQLGDQDALQAGGTDSDGLKFFLNEKPISNKALLVDGITDAVQVSVGSPMGSEKFGFTCALLKTGEVRCWGITEFAGVGYGTWQKIKTNIDGIGCGSFATPTPTKVMGVEKALNLSSGSEHSCITDLQGLQKTIKCWGRNSAVHQNLGYGPDNKTSYEAKPVSLSGDIKQIAVGDRFTCALMSDKGVKCWGSNTHGQLGIPKDTLSSMIPVTVKDSENSQIQLTGAKELAVASVTGNGTACVLTDDHQIKCWGDGKPCNKIIVE